MRHRKLTAKFGRRSAHTRSMLANQTVSLIMNGQITTTVEKAKATKRLAEKMVTYAKKGDLHHRRLAISKIKDKAAVRHLFDSIAPTFADRKGGYTKIVRLGTRRGDNAETCLLQWVNFIPSSEQTTAPAKEKKETKKSATEKTAKATKTEESKK